MFSPRHADSMMRFSSPRRYAMIRRAAPRCHYADAFRAITLTLLMPPCLLRLSDAMLAPFAADAMACHAAIIFAFQFFFRAHHLRATAAAALAASAPPYYAPLMRLLSMLDSAFAMPYCAMPDYFTLFSRRSFHFF